ncbi:MULTISPECIES: hypothetical protein [Clostridium]|uniref:Uncharacterized protein n=1 Tax=Clostridium senegalense TaxID=1465809 RepID=A0A6M0H1A8_9CLOT|nr:MULTISPECIES: hypothetical protein [Clostridium]NEU03661.1 hypothetical protein [Clostridium senegalense]
MKGFTNVTFFYNNVKFSEPYLDNTYRKNLENGKYVMENKLISYQETVKTLATTDNDEDLVVYNFSKDHFENIKEAKKPYNYSKKKLKINKNIDKIIRSFSCINEEYNNNLYKLLLLSVISLLNCIISSKENTVIMTNTLNLVIIWMSFIIMECWGNNKSEKSIKDNI